MAARVAHVEADRLAHMREPSVGITRVSWTISYWIATTPGDCVIE